MAKKKKQENLPEGMSRRQAKLAARAAERAALAKDPRPYKDLPYEVDLVALQEFVPSGTAEVRVKGVDQPVLLCTVLPGGVAALWRDADAGGDILVALQTQHRSQNPHRDLARALQWVQGAGPGQTLEVAVGDGTEPPLSELLEAQDSLEIQEYQDFSWWVPAGSEVAPEYAQIIQRASDQVFPSQHVDAKVPGAVWWIDPGTKAHIRWVRAEEEEKVLNALARIAGRGELDLGAATKFAGVFRTHGLVVPVWDLPREEDAASFTSAVEALNEKIVAELDNDEPLDADARRQLQNIKSRQVTI